MLDRIEIDLRGTDTLTLYIDVTDNSLSRKWLTALNNIIRDNLHLEKNYCWMGWTESPRNAEIGVWIRFVGPKDFGAQDAIPGQSRVLGHVSQQADIAIRERTNRITTLESLQSFNAVCPRR